MRRRRIAGLVLVPLGALVLGIIEPAVSASAVHARAHRVEAGTAAATANVLGITPGVSGLTLSATIGEATAAYQHTETQAKSGTLDLGALGLVLATSQFCGRPELAEEDQPQPLTADSETGRSHATHGSPGFGQEAVSVARDPESATATTTTIDQSLPGIVSIRGRSRAEVRYVDGLEQVATSSVTEDISLLSGQIRLQGMRWTAKRTSGASTTRKTDFTFGRVSIAGVPMAAPDSAPGSTITAINTVLAPVGLSVREPVRSTNHQTGSVAIGPLTLRFSGSAIERAAIGPAGDGVVTLERLLKSLGSPGDNCAQVRELIDNVDNNASTLVHIALAVAEGAGALDLQFGGVAAAAQDPATFANPFGNGGLLPPALHGPRGKPASTNPLGSGSTAAGGGAVNGSGPTSAPPVLAAAAQHCVSTSPSRAHGCWHGLATLASTGALAVGVVLLFSDVALTRRRRNEKRSVDASE